MVDLVAGDVLDEVDGFPLIDPQAHQVHQDGVVDGAAVLHIGGARSILCGFLALLVGDALTLLLSSASGGLFRLACSVGFGLLAGQFGGFGIAPGLFFTFTGGLGLALCLLLAVLGGFTLQALAILFLPASLLRRLFGYLALAVDALLFGLLLAQLRQFGLFCAHLGQPDLAQHPDYATAGARSSNRAALRQRLVAMLTDQDGPALAQVLMDIGVPCAPVLSVSAALQHPHTAHSQMMVRIGQHYTGVGAPIKLSRTPATYRLAPPVKPEPLSPPVASDGDS